MARGGKRRNAGRKAGKPAERTVAAITAAEGILVKLGGDATWLWAMQQAKKKHDYRTVAEIMKYWTDRAKGKAPQSVKLEGNTSVEFIFGESSRPVGDPG